MCRVSNQTRTLRTHRCQHVGGGPTRLAKLLKHHLSCLVEGLQLGKRQQVLQVGDLLLLLSSSRRRNLLRGHHLMDSLKVANRLKLEARLRINLHCYILLFLSRLGHG